MVRQAGFFVDQVGEDLSPSRLIVAAGVDGGEVSGERGDVLVILAGVIGERFAGELAAGPGEGGGVGEQMFGGDLLVDGVEVLVHKISPVGAAEFLNSERARSKSFAEEGGAALPKVK